MTLHIASKETVCNVIYGNNPKIASSSEILEI